MTKIDIISGFLGAGKTTLLKLLTGELTADEGEFFVSQDTRVGYLKQRDNFDSEGTVIGEIDKIFTEIHALEAAHLPWDLIDRVTTRIVNEVDHVNRVVYDCTGKPPGTIEFE